MSENQTEFDLIELESLNRSSSLSNHSTTSVSSRSTLIRELITSQKSKQIIDEIDNKISQLVDVIKSKNCNDKRKKYYAKKIVSRIIDNKCSEPSINTFDFRNSDLASSTPYESRDKTPKTPQPQKSPPIDKSPQNYQPTSKSPIVANLIDASPKTETPPYYETTPLTTNRAVDLKQRLKKLAEEIENYTKTPSNSSPVQETRLPVTEKLEKPESQANSPQVQIQDTNNRIGYQDGGLRLTKDEQVQTSFEIKVIDKNDNINKKFEDLTPKTLSVAYKNEFGDSDRVSQPKKIESPNGLDDTQNKDWKSYKTTSEKIFEKNELSRRLAKEYIIKYARKEKERQIEWITNEIQSLTKLKEILEKNSVENLSLSSLSSGKNSRSSSQDKFNCTGARTLQEINTCLEELRQILQEKKCNVKNGVKKLESSTSSNNTEPDTLSKVTGSQNGRILRKVDSGTESSTSYQVLCKKFTKPTEFEVKYFHESNFLSSSSEDKENFINFQENFGTDDVKKSIYVQTSVQSSPKFSRDFMGAGDFSSLKITNSEKSNLTKNRSVAYILTFEESNRIKNGDRIKSMEKTSLEKIVVKIPPPRKQRSKLTSTVPSEMELQEALVRNRSDFVKAAEFRRQCINELTYMRDKRYEDINKRILFTTKEMRDITSKRYKYSAEVQNKIKNQQNQMQKLFNRQLATVFSKKLQEKTLKGQVTIDTAKTVTYS